MGSNEAGVDPDIATLVSLGLSEDEAQVAVREGRVLATVAHRLLGGAKTYTAEDVARRSGLTRDYLLALDHALGLSPQDRYGEIDVEHATHLARLLHIAPAEPLLGAARTDAHLLRQLALADLQFVRDHFIVPIREAGGGDVDVAVAIAQLTETLLPIAAGLVGSAYRRILTNLLASDLVTSAVDGGDEVVLSVGFVDMVGYTSLSARIDPAGLGDVLQRFEDRCHAAVGSNSGVALVKFLGDAAMYVARDPVELAQPLVELVTAEDDGDDPRLRAGFAHGPVLTRGGDFFGDTVNLAARLTDLARPGSVVADDALRDALEERFDLSRLPATRLRGLGTHRPLRLRPADHQSRVV